MTKLFLIIVGVAMIGAMTACNTVSGVGQDVSAVGRDISAGARGVERGIRND